MPRHVLTNRHAHVHAHVPRTYPQHTKQYMARTHGKNNEETTIQNKKETLQNKDAQPEATVHTRTTANMKQHKQNKHKQNNAVKNT